MPANPLTALDKVYLSVFFNTRVESFRNEPYVIAMRPQGDGLAADGRAITGTERTTPAQQRTVSLAFHTTGNMARVYAPQGWSFVDPRLPAGDQWIGNRDAFIRHALGLIGR